MAVLGCLSLLLWDEGTGADFGAAHGGVAVVDAIANMGGARHRASEMICRVD